MCVRKKDRKKEGYINVFKEAKMAYKTKQEITFLSVVLALRKTNHNKEILHSTYKSK